MRKVFKKAISALLVAVMLLSIAPLSGFVGLELPSFAEIFTPKSEAATYYGTCGVDLTWSFNTSSGVLSISGTGAMTNRSYSSDIPWYNYRESIKSVTIGNGVTSIGDYAFYYCTSLTSVTIPNGVTSIGNYAFTYCTSLTSITIPDSVTSIGSSAFYFCDDLTSITIPDSVTSIGDRAFMFCDNLKSVKISNSITAIGNAVFDTCMSLESITIPDGVTSIGYDAFLDCDSLTNVTIPDSVTSIGKKAFYLCDKLTSITIPDSVTSIGDQAFCCVIIESITVDENNKNYSNDEYGVLFNKDKTTLIQCPRGYKSKSYIIPDSVTSIGSYAFFSCDNLEGVTIPDSITSIGEGAFYHCDNLVSVIIPDSVISIGDSAFASCSNLASILIPDSVTTIGSSAFNYCTSLVNVTISDSVTSIGSYAFNNCTSLASITIPCSVTSIGNFAFEKCDSLSGVTVDSANTTYSNDEYGVLFNKDKTELIFYLGKSRTSYAIPDSVTSIGGSAFRNCTSLISVAIPDSVTSIGSSAFYNCTSLKNVYYTGDESEWNKISIGSYNESLSNATIHYNYDNDGKEPPTDLGECGEKLTWKFYESTGELIISGTGAMYGWSYSSNIPWDDYRESIKTVTIPNGVTSIGYRAFYCCTSLKSVAIPDSVTTIGEYTFYNCTSLASVVIPDSVTTIGSYAFSYCTSLTSVTIPDSVTSIGGHAFRNCTSLTSITVDKNNPDYSSDEYGVLFNKNKTELIQYPAGNTRTSYEIPDSVTSIGDSAFEYCTSLTSVTIPNSVTSIGSYAFYNCTSLTSVTIPNSVTSIGSYAFYFCSKLSDVYYSGTETEWNAMSINPGNAYLTNATIHYNHTHNHYLIATQNPTCTEKGTEVYTCVCGYSFTEIIPALNHKDTLVQVGAKAPTCTEIGWDAYEYCTACTYTTYVEKDALKHNIIIDEAVAPTCTSTGLTAGQHCTRCDDITISQEVIPALNHKDTLVKVDAKAPTCTEIGWDAYEYCTVCDYTTYAEKEALKHNIIIDEAVDATCTSTGLTAGQHCSRCDDMTVSQEVVPALNHKDTLVQVGAKVPTCTEIGWDAYEYCTACTYTTYVEKDALKHDIVIDKAVEATCTSTGLTAGQHCSRCDDMTVEQEVVPVKLHNPTEKYDSSKHWKECVCGLKSNEENHSFTDGNICSCGYRRKVNATLSIKNNMGSKTINYGETLKLSVNVTNKPTNAKICWYVDGVKRAEGEVFEISFENGSKIVTVKLVDSNGVVYEDANGNEISDSQTVTVNGGFFQKIISFFKNLFGMNRTVVQMLTGRI